MAATILLILAVGGNLLIGLFTFLKNPRRATNILFLLLTATIALWAAVTEISRIVPTEENLPWIRTVITVAVFLNFFVFLTLHTFPSERIKLRPEILTFFVVWTVVQAIINTTSFVFKGIVLGTNQPVPAPGIITFALHNIFFLGGAVIILIRRFRRAIGLEKKQFGFILAGIAFSFALILITQFILVVVLNTTDFIVLGSFCTLIFVGMTSYAIVKHQLLDIRLVIARVLAYGLVVLAVAAAYAGVLMVALGFFQDQYHGIAATVLTVFAMVSFQPLKHAITRAVDKVLWSGEYDPEELSARVIDVGSSTIVLDHLAKKLLETLVGGLRARYGTLIIFKNDKVYYRAGFSQPQEKKPPVLATTSIATLVRNGTLIFDELPEGKQRSFLRKEQIAVATPLHVEKELVALLVLGDKMKGTGYTLRDIKFLERVVPAIGLATQNAKAYEEISRFADTLKKKVAEATAELRVANVRLEELNEMKSNFVSIASHQLRAPIGGIRSYLAMMKDGDLGPTTPKQREVIQMNMEELRHMLAVIQMFLDVTKMEAGKIELERKPADLKTMAAEVIAELAESAKRKGLELKTALAAVPKVSLDAERMRNVVINLIENAIKYTEAGSVEVSLRRTNGRVEFRVKDSGIGIAPDEIPKLFAKFVRAGGGFKVSHGSGLGLYIVKTLVEAHGGEAFVESPGVGKGSTFGFRLPIK